MKKTFTLNGKEVQAKEFTFGLIVDLEDMGLSIDDMSKKPMSMIRAYIGLCLGVDKDVASDEMEQHLLSGGDFESVVDAMSYMMENSNFFRRIGQTEKKKKTTTSTNL